MLTFTVEKLSEIKDEVYPLLLEHWDEIALNKENVPLDPDWDAYKRLEDMGVMNVTVARDDSNKIVGYVNYIFGINLHYKNLMVANNDIFYLHELYRKGTNGIRLIREAEKNVIKACSESGKPYDFVYILNKEKDHFREDGRSVTGTVLEHLDYTLIEHNYAKLVRR